MPKVEIYRMIQISKVWQKVIKLLLAKKHAFSGGVFVTANASALQKMLSAFSLVKTDILQEFAAQQNQRIMHHKAFLLFLAFPLTE